MTIEIHSSQAPLNVVMEYARAVQSAAMLPEAYRGKPADIMLAIGLGQSMGLSPAESLYRISVIKGRPTASAELIAANVRKAGHKLRVRIDEAAQSVTATIYRADDPEFPFEVTRDMAWAKQMGLATNDNYRKQALTMLQWRAITAAARLACPEALYGVSYTPDEIEVDAAPVRATQVATSGADRLKAALQPEPQPTPLVPSSDLAKAMFASFNEAGITDRDDRLTYATDVVGRDVTSSKDMTEDDARAVLRALDADLHAAEQQQTFENLPGGAA